METLALGSSGSSAQPTNRYQQWGCLCGTGLLLFNWCGSFSVVKWSPFLGFRCANA